MLLTLLLAAGIAFQQSSPDVIEAAERALFLAAPRAYMAYAAALKAQAAAFENGGLVLRGALRARARADAAEAEAREARNEAGRRAFDQAVEEVGMIQTPRGYEVAPDAAWRAQRQAESEAMEAVIEAQESKTRIYKKTDIPAVRTFEAAKRSVFQAERRLCRSAPGPWLAYVEAADRDGVLIPPC